MKKFISLLAVVLALVLCAMPAMAAVGDVTIYHQGERGSSLRRIAYLNGLLYITTYDNTYYIWNKATGETTEMSFDTTGYEIENGYTEFRSMIASEDALYAFMVQYESDEETGSNTFTKAFINKLDVGADGALTFSDTDIELDFDDMIEYYDDYSYVRDMNYPTVVNGKLCFYTYSDNGNTMMIFDLETGDYEDYDCENVERICSYKDGMLLACVCTYEADSSKVEIMSFDIESGDMELVREISLGQYSTPGNLGYSAASDSLYYTYNGEIFRLSLSDAEAQAESVAAIQIENYSNASPVITEDGFFICSDYETVIMRNTDPTQRCETSLTVYTGYNNAVQNAYYDFTKAHSDVEVVLANNYEQVTQAMMNQSDSVDIYVLSVQGSDFYALYKRGYLAELTSSAKLTEFTGGMYDKIKNILYREGELVAVPVENYSDSMSINKEAFKKLGYTDADVPTSWMGLYKLLQELPSRLTEDSGVTVFDSYYTQQDMKNTMFYSMLQHYFIYMQQNPDAEQAIDTDLLRTLTAELDKVDFAALGLIEEYPEDGTWFETSDTQLFNTYSTASCEVYGYNSNFTVMPLAVDDGMEPMLMSYLSVAIVNPYSKNRDLAIEYLENVVDLLTDTFKTNLIPALNEPIKNAYYEENLKYYQESIDSIKAEIEKATDETLADWQSQLEETEKYMEEYTAEYAYDVSVESIAAYREYGKYLTPAQYFLGDDKNGGEFYSQIQQYLEGTIDGATMLKNLDKKYKMMLMEEQ